MDRIDELEGIVSDLAMENIRTKRRNKRSIQSTTTTNTTVQENRYGPVWIAPVTVVSVTPGTSIAETAVDLSAHVPSEATAVVVSVRLVIPAATTETKAFWLASSGGSEYELVMARVEASDGISAQATMPIANQRFYYKTNNNTADLKIELQGYLT